MRKSAHSARRVILFLTIAGMLGTSAPAYAAVPTYVVEFELNTKFERSLERFLFDLFNTLQRREEDFTAAFELQKIEKAREDTAKLFQEVQEELQDYGRAFFSQQDPKLVGTDDDSAIACSTDDSSTYGSLSAEGGCPPTISPIKDSRIIHDPYQYLFGEAYVKAQVYLFCYYNYLAWDQGALLGGHPQYGSWLGPTFDELKATYDPADSRSGPAPAADQPVPNASSPKSVTGSVQELLKSRDRLVVSMHRGHEHYKNFPLYEIYGDITDTSGRLSDEAFAEIEPRCRQAMHVLGAESPVTIERDVEVWADIRQRSTGGPGPTDEQKDGFRRSLWNLPTLQRDITRRGPFDPWSWEEFSRAQETANNIQGIEQHAINTVQGIIGETQAEREATYIAGRGIRPEQLYETHFGETDGEYIPGYGPVTNTVRFDLNTEYVISPAVMLLQKMQAATQATFDLAGQGFLYLDAESTPDDILGAYNLVSTRGNNEERRICNNAGACQLLDAWLKPAASFRSTVTVQDLDGNGAPDRLQPAIIGPTGGTPAAQFLGSGLPAPWEDEGFYANVANEKAEPNWTTGGGPPGTGGVDINTTRYTIGRYLLSGGGRDEFDSGDNITDNAGSTLPGDDYPINDWYDRVLEMYEGGIGGLKLGEGPADLDRRQRNRSFSLADWQCYIATWFIPQGYTGNSGGSYYGTSFYYLGLDNGVNPQTFLNTYCE